MRAAGRCSRTSRWRRRNISASSRRATRELLQRDPQLESRPTFLFFKGAANGLFAEGAERLMRGVNDQQALMIGIRCERGSHRFFKKYGERFEDSEGKQIFLEFADEERDHLDLADSRIPRARQATGPIPPRHPLVVDHRTRERAVTLRPAQVTQLCRAVTGYDLHLHTTASDGRCSPLELVEQAAAAGLAVMAATDHDTTASVEEVRVARRGAGDRCDCGHRNHRRRRRPRHPRARLLPEHRRSVVP